MAKLFDTDAAIERIVKDRRQYLVTAKRAALENEQARITELNKELKREDRHPVPDVDREMGLFETQVDRRMKMLEVLANKNCKAFKEEAAKHGEPLDFEVLTTQSVEAALYGFTIYFSVMLGRHKEAVI